MSEPNKETTEEIIQRWLSPSQAKALRQYCSENGVSENDKEALAQLLGRGYRPPETVEGWKEIHETVRRLWEIAKSE